MRKSLLFSLVLLSATSSFAEVKTVTIPAVPNGKCSFIVKEIPDSLGLDENELLPLQTELVGKEFVKDTTLSYLTSNEDTIKCTVSTGKRMKLTANDTLICASDSIYLRSLVQLEENTYWGKNLFTGEYELKKGTIDFHIEPVDHESRNPIDSLVTVDGIKNIYYNNELGSFPLLDMALSDKWEFLAVDTVTGCWASDFANVSIRYCGSIHWLNYGEPKEYRDYRSYDYLSYLKEDSIMVLDPRVNCICPLPLDTIVESTQSPIDTVCEHYKYDVTVKLAAHLDGESDTIVAYVLHLNDAGSTFEIHPDTMIAQSIGNCLFVVPQFEEVLPDCRCGSYYYSKSLTPGDTIYSSADQIYTFKNYCTGNVEVKGHIIVPDKDMLIQATTGDTTVYAKDSTYLRALVRFDGIKPAYIRHSGTMAYETNYSIVYDSYFGDISEENKIDEFLADANQWYRLDTVAKSGKYYFIAKDTLTGCELTHEQIITVIDTTNSAPLHLADIYDEKGDIYTISGAIVMKNVYLNEVMDRLKNGIYIFNNKKIFINRKK